MDDKCPKCGSLMMFIRKSSGQVLWACCNQHCNYTEYLNKNDSDEIHAQAIDQRFHLTPEGKQYIDTKIDEFKKENPEKYKKIKKIIDKSIKELFGRR